MIEIFMHTYFYKRFYTRIRIVNLRKLEIFKISRPYYVRRHVKTFVLTAVESNRFSRSIQCLKFPYESIPIQKSAPNDKISEF